MTATGYSNASASMSNNGAWSVSVPGMNWHFSGALGTSALAPHLNNGTDALGPYQEVAFSYSVSTSSRAASIRVYAARPVVLFNITYNNFSSNTSPFPVVTSWPALSHLAFTGEFAGPDFTDLDSDTPWAFFDNKFNTYILSSGDNYMTASLSTSGTKITTGISTKIPYLPAGFTHKTVLTFGQGINDTFIQWGQAITDLGGKKRPANDSDPLLKNISYWTDNGATYYYNPGPTSYMATLNAIRAEFTAKGVQLGTLQLDSWWYPKGPDNSWSSHSGIWTYTAAPDLFQPDLGSFQAGLNKPLITHARWIDSASPYRSKYAMSNNVITDPQYWEDIGAYLKNSGVTVYEQDWLGENAQADFNLDDSNSFLGNMAASMASRGIDIQYCMAEPKHFLQSTHYSNVTNIRTSQDRFGSNRWTSYFYSSRFASAIGLWPFADTFMSSETGNMIASVLSAGPVGVGDALGALSRTNLTKAARPDGILVKPDVSATPIDSVIFNDAQGVDVPMVASTWSDFGNGLRANYLFAYPRATNNTLTIDPSTYGISGASYLYNYLAASSAYIPAGSTKTLILPQGASYFVLVPVGASGIGLLGDAGHFVTMGRQRIPTASDDGGINLTVAFAPGETARTISGFSAQPLTVSSVTGSHRTAAWDPASQLFTVVVHPSSKGTATLRISPLTGQSVTDLACTGTHCGR